MSMETSLRPVADRAAIGLSILCAVHCLAVPVLVVLVPSMSSLFFTDESFHVWMVVVVLPVSAGALFLGCTRHRSLRVLASGLAGLCLLASTAWLGHEVLGETFETVFTLAGAALVALSHVLNYRRCRELQAGPELSSAKAVGSS